MKLGSLVIVVIGTLYNDVQQSAMIMQIGLPELPHNNTKPSYESNVNL